MRNIHIYILFNILFFIGIKGQVGIGTESPSNSSILEINSNNKGLLINTVQLASIISTAPFSSNIEGMWIYNSATAGTFPNNVIPGLYYNDGTKWILMSVNDESQKIGDIKSSVQTQDHDGWFLMNGRNISTLPAIAQTNAAALGYSAILPDSTDRMIKGINSSTETSAQSSGTNSYTIIRANFPNVTITGTTASAGAHTHSYTNRGVTMWHYTAGNQGALRYNNTETRTTGAAGNHTHNISVASGGTQTPIVQYPKHFVVQYFVYLGK
jgi:hypothetical protein